MKKKKNKFNEFNIFFAVADEFPRSTINYDFKEIPKGFSITDLENANLEFKKIEKDVIEFAKILEKGMSKKDLKQ